MATEKSMCRKAADFDKFFDRQLEHLKTGHIDYYLLHMLTDMKTWNTLCDWGIREWVDEKKRAGQIQNFGFSFHGAHNDKWCDITWIIFICITGVVTASLAAIFWDKLTLGARGAVFVAIIMPLHVLEEWKFPGGLHIFYNVLLGSKEEEKQQLDRYPILNITAAEAGRAINGEFGEDSKTRVRLKRTARTHSKLSWEHLIESTDCFLALLETAYYLSTEMGFASRFAKTI